jgi:hypothetical protein
MAITLSTQTGTPVISGLTPDIFVEVRIQDTGRGGYKVYRRQADADGTVTVSYPNFDQGKSVSVRELVPTGSPAHDLIFTKDSTPFALHMVDATVASPPSTPSTPQPANSSSESFFHKLEDLAGAITGTTTAPPAQGDK